jgi:hypothetical protein
MVCFFGRRFQEGRNARAIKERIPPNRPHYLAVMGFLYRAADAIRRRYLKHDHGAMGEDLAHR